MTARPPGTLPSPCRAARRFRVQDPYLARCASYGDGFRCFRSRGLGQKSSWTTGCDISLLSLSQNIVDRTGTQGFATLA